MVKGITMQDYLERSKATWNKLTGSGLPPSRAYVLTMTVRRKLTWCAAGHVAVADNFEYHYRHIVWDFNSGRKEGR
jgi:hypothetical protein